MALTVASAILLVALLLTLALYFHRRFVTMSISMSIVDLYSA